MKEMSFPACTTCGLEMLEPRLMMAGTLYVVDSLADTVANDGALTLREALQAANTDTPVNEAPAGSSTETDVITFDADLFTGGTATIHLSGTQLEITSDLSIQGPETGSMTIDAGGLSRVLSITGAGTDATLDGLTLTGGASGIANGGGVYVGGGTVALSDCTISGNSASVYGGGVFVLGGTVTVTGGTVSGNTAPFGGGVYELDGNVTVTGVIVSDNHSSNVGPYTSSGGGLYVQGGTATLADTVIRGNSATNGGGMYVHAGVVTLLNCTVSGNWATTGGGIYNQGLSTTLNNTIVSLNTASSQTTDLSGSLAGQGNLIGGDPGFVRNPSAGPDGTWGTTDDDAGDLHLRMGSPCVDRGVNALAVNGQLTTDADGLARIFGSQVDIGAYEFNTWHVVLLGGHGGTLHFIDADGTATIVRYKGPGSITIDRVPSGQGPAGEAWGDIQAITIDGSDAASKLSIATRGRSETNVGDVVVHGPLKAIAAGRTNLLGDLTVEGSLRALRLGDVQGGTMSVGPRAAGDTRTTLRVKLDEASDEGLTSQTPIRTLKAAAWLNTDAVADLISAPTIGEVRIHSDFAADLTLTDTGALGASLGSFRAAGTITGGVWTLTGGARLIRMHASSAAWQATFGDPPGSADVGSLVATKGDLAGQITARAIGNIRSKGSMSALTLVLAPT